MNRNTQAHFAQTPSLTIGRSKFDRSFTHKTSFNAADLVPFYCAEILPGDTVKMNTANVVRMTTPITPVMDNANLDTYFFFVPNRLVWEHWQEFMGENKTAPWIQTTEYEVPQIVAPDNGWTKGSLADYFGFPTKIGGYKASALPFRAYALIYNEWFRSEVLQNPLYIHEGDADINGVDITDANLDPITDVEKGACCAKVDKYFDYFTGCTPSAQRGPAVNVPIGTSAPIIGTDNIKTGDTLETALVGKELYIKRGTVNGYTTFAGDADSTTAQTAGNSIGLAADLSNAVGATVNQLRQAFQIQKFYERQAMGGTRYIELIKSHFSVTNPDFRFQRPEYLGGMQTPININQVVQTDSTSQQLGGSYKTVGGQEVWEWEMSDLTPQGNTAAYSLTSGRNKDLFTHSFTEHGLLIGVCCVRTVHTYQQGLNRMFSRKKFYDYYWPEFANLGNTAVLNKEIYLQGPTAINPSTGKEYDEEAFGYQEAWADYRYQPDQVTGELRSNYSQSLDIWHWADDYSSMPTLGDEWIEETKNNIARTLAVQNHDQFWGDFYFQAIFTRPMPMYSVPGLIDHH